MAVFFYSSEKFQLTASTKSVDSVLWQLHAFQCGLVYCLRVVLLAIGGATGISRKQDTSVGLLITVVKCVLLLHSQPFNTMKSTNAHCCR